MSFRMMHKTLTCLGISALIWLALPAPGWAQAFGIPCGVDCGPRHCPPHYHVFVERPPRLWWRHSCPHPICNPCDLPHFGYFETCWNPWPFPPNWSHCSAPPPASMVNLNPYVNPNLPQPTPNVLPPARPSYDAPSTLPAPRIAPNPGDNGLPALPNRGGVEELPRPRPLQNTPSILNR